MAEKPQDKSPGQEDASPGGANWDNELTIDNGQLTIVVSLRDEFESVNDYI